MTMFSKKFKTKLKAIKAILFANEYFVTVANQKNLYGPNDLGPIYYEYISNTDRELFYVFVKGHIKDLKLTDKLK